MRGGRGVEFRILGPLEVTHGGRPIGLGGPQRRAVLAALLLNANRTVSVEQLIRTLWEHDAPTSARSLVHGCVARLRAALRAASGGRDPLLTREPGYLLRVAPGELDLDQFTDLVSAAAREVAAGAEAAELLRTALGLSRGPALADITLPGIRAAAEGLDERIMSALEDRIDLDLAYGTRQGLIEELSGLTRAHPLRERVWAQLMLARCAAQRPAEALATYRELRHNLVEQLGIEPGDRLRRLERAILSGEDVLAAHRAELDRRHPPRSHPPAPLVAPAPVPMPPVPTTPVPPGGAGAAVLVGRGREVARIHEALARLADGPVVLGIAGDPGIGKTRLLDELAGQARRAHRPVLAGRAAEFEREIPFAVVRNALDDELRSMEPGRLDRLTGTERLLLATVFPALERGTADEAGLAVLAAERYRLHRAVRSLLEILAEPAGLVLILDDLHWCDDGSAELLAHLMRHPPAAAILFGVAYRPRQLAVRLHHEIVGAAQRGAATLLDVGPLAFEEAAALLPARLSTSRRRQLYDAGGGNPFYLELLARSRTDNSGAPDVPAAQAALAGEFAVLPGEHRRVVHAAALAGDVFDPGLVAVVADLALDRVLDAVDELCLRDLIRPDGPGFRFRHPLLRTAAYQHAGSGWRVAAHARAAAELARRGAPLPERAGHLALSAAPGDLEAIGVLRAAAEEAMHATPAAAAHWLGAALQLLPQLPTTFGLRLHLLNLRARALGITGHLAESRDLLAEVLRMVPAGTDERVTVLGFLTMLEHLLGNHGQAKALLAGELSSLPDRHSGAAGALRVAVVLSGILQGTVEIAEIHAAVDLARSIGDRPLLASALTVSAVASHSFDVASPRTGNWVDEATVLVDSMSDAELSERLDAALFLGWAQTYLERFGSVSQLLDRALRVARRTGQSHLVGPLHMLVGVVHCTVGDLTRAAVVLDDAMESAVLTGGEQTRGRLLVYQSWVSAWAGDLPTALALAQESVALGGGGSGIGWQSGRAEANLAFVRLAAGDPHGCLELMLDVGGGPDLPAVRQVWQPPWFETLAAAAAAAGQHRLAAEFAARAARLPTIDHLSHRAALIRLAQVHPLLHTDPTRAARLAQEAAVHFDRAGDRLGAARARHCAATALRAAGDPDTATRVFAEARQAFTACGADPHWLGW